MAAGSSKKKRGAQPGNLNALKHGFYSEQFRETEVEDLESLLDGGLKDEIALLRVMLRRFLQVKDGFDNLNEAARVLQVINTTAGTLANLLRIQASIGRQDNETLDIINEVIEEILGELAVGK